MQDYSKEKFIVARVKVTENNTFVSKVFTRSKKNGHAPAMRIFRKMSKLPFSIYREKGFLTIVYVDGLYLQGDDYEFCFSNILNTTEILSSFGFTIHQDKSKFMPTQCISPTQDLF